MIIERVLVLIIINQVKNGKQAKNGFKKEA